MWNLERFGYKFLFGVVSWPQKLFNFMVKNSFVWTWFSCVRGEKVLKNTQKLGHSLGWFELDGLGWARGET